MNIGEPQSKLNHTGYAIWQLPFRSFFLAASLFSGVSLLVWLVYLITQPSLEQPMFALIWHIHEMLFGFGALVAAGFVLTAVQTWTGKASITGRPVGVLLTIWLAGRLAIWLAPHIGLVPAILLQALWWLSIIYVFSRLVWLAKNQRNYVFTIVFTAMGTVNLVMLIAYSMDHMGLALHMGRSGVLMFTLLMGLMGGRVIPFFTARGAKIDPIIPSTFIERSLPVVSLCGVAIFVLNYFISLPVTPAPLMIATGVLHLLRIARWRSLKTTSVPLLWSLHLSYFFMAIGLLFLGLSFLELGIVFSSALHLITVGALGLMIFSMMSRVSLGHTGRKLDVTKWIKLSFLLLATSAIARAGLSQLGLHQLSWLLSAIPWAMASLIFFLTYLPILIKPKQI